MMPVDQPLRSRRRDAPYGSLTLFDNQRVAPGSMIQTPDVDVARDQVKSFGFTANRQGSYFIDVSYGGTFHKFASGTFTAGEGTVMSLGFELPYAQARARVQMSQGGTASVEYGGFARRLL